MNKNNNGPKYKYKNYQNALKQHFYVFELMTPLVKFLFVFNNLTNVPSLELFSFSSLPLLIYICCFLFIFTILPGSKVTGSKYRGHLKDCVRSLRMTNPHPNLQLRTLAKTLPVFYSPSCVHTNLYPYFKTELRIATPLQIS